MRILLLFSMIHLTGFCQNISQLGLIFPESFVLDVFDRNIEQLGVRQIIQYSKDSTVFYADTTKNSSANYSLDYILDYDSLHRPKKFKYDFQLNTRRTLTSVDSPISIIVNIDSAHTFAFSKGDSIRVYDYFEYTFNYQLRDLVNVEVFNPSSFRGTLDGVYIEKSIERTKTTINEVDTNGKLLQSEIYIDGKLIQTRKYSYKSFEKNKIKKELLSSIYYSGMYGTKITFLQYKFD